VCGTRLLFVVNKQVIPRGTQKTKLSVSLIAQNNARTMCQMSGEGKLRFFKRKQWPRNSEHPSRLELPLGWARYKSGVFSASFSVTY